MFYYAFEFIHPFIVGSLLYFLPICLVASIEKCNFAARYFVEKCSFCLPKVIEKCK